MLGMGGGAEGGAGLIAGIIYEPYYIATFLAAAVVTWGFPQTWDWTRTITWPKVAGIAVLLWLSLIVLGTQMFNPFIYFIF
jgi:alginate O-acetyltransferase complex protein AlgI